MTTSNHTPDTIEIQLTRGYVAIVDAVDADLSSTSWYANPTCGKWYAVHRNGPAPSIPQRRTLLMHRVIMERILGRPLVRKDTVDHIDNNGLNNTRANLRIATRSQNAHNSKKRASGTNRLKGASWHKQMGKWRAYITIDARQISLGLFDTQEEAHAEYCKAATEYAGEFARFE